MTQREPLVDLDLRLTCLLDTGIQMIGEDKEDHWVRIDGIVKTNMPEARLGFQAIESRTHGHVLFVALDHSATRIGYVLSAEMFKKYGRKMSKVRFSG